MVNKVDLKQGEGSIVCMPKRWKCSFFACCYAAESSGCTRRCHSANEAANGSHKQSGPKLAEYKSELFIYNEQSFIRRIFRCSGGSSVASVGRSGLSPSTCVRHYKVVAEMRTPEGSGGSGGEKRKGFINFGYSFKRFGNGSYQFYQSYQSYKVLSN